MLSFANVCIKPDSVALLTGSKNMVSMDKKIYVSETPKHMHRLSCVVLNFIVKSKGHSNSSILYSIVKPELRPLLPALSGYVK